VYESGGDDKDGDDMLWVWDQEEKKKKEIKRGWCGRIKICVCVRCVVRTPIRYDVTHTPRVRESYPRFWWGPKKVPPCVMYSHWSHCFIILKLKQWVKFHRV